MRFKEVLEKFRSESATEKDKGTKFERLIKAWFLTDKRYGDLEKVWLWEEFPSRKDFGGKDLGIDLVAKTVEGEYWAVQCKCYAEDAVIDKPMVDSFLATSSKTFVDSETLCSTGFALRVWVSTTSRWGTNAEESLKNQSPEVIRIGLADLEASAVCWDKLLGGKVKEEALAQAKQPMKHQMEAVQKAYEHYIERNNHRGSLIMACGTGKTYTSLLIAERLLENKGLVLFMVPSIALLGQALNAWCADAKQKLKAVCVCSDSKVAKRMTSGKKGETEDDDAAQESVIDLAYPATTNTRSIVRQLLSYRGHEGLVVVFSTYQSIDAVSEAQRELLRKTKGEWGKFDLIVCDEAHRTTGAKLAGRDESSFTKIHSDENIQGAKRMYMTATPRVYGTNAKTKAAKDDLVLCSMDDAELYGEVFYRVSFSYAVANDLLCDYKVLVMTVSESDLPDNIEKDVRDVANSANYDDTAKLIGAICGLSKRMRGDDNLTWQSDPRIMHRALAFCPKIGSESQAGSSKYVAAVLEKLSEKFDESFQGEQLARTASVSARHIDGSMNSQERNEILQWLSEAPTVGRECRVVTNVRCLSEGVDVPSLDAVLFLSARKSQVDIVQSVGRVMRTFHKGATDEKRYGYIILPVFVPQDVSVNEALDKNKFFDVVWQVLNALRSHDERFQATVEKIKLNKQNPALSCYQPSIMIGQCDTGMSWEEKQALQLSNSEVAKQLEARFGELQREIYVRVAEECGERMYWESWAKEVGAIAVRFKERIARMIGQGQHREEFSAFLKGLQHDLNPSVDEAQAIEMLAQHLVTRPVFDALFKEYRFVENNAVSRSMQAMIDILLSEGFEKDTEVLNRFYDSVKQNVGDIDNFEGKQTVVKNLYGKFFKSAFPLVVEKLGIVYTPIECVDFILHSVEQILQKEFDCSLSDEGVHVLDPFVGTGTFVTRLLQSGLIKPKDLERKYRSEIHCNEMVLLAYYVADVNIESVFHELTKRESYLPYNRICLTDTFQLAENKDFKLDFGFSRDNSERVEEQIATPVRVILGNPPYSVGQGNANDAAQNQSYPQLEQRIAETYVKASTNKGKTVQALYDSYIKAFRWATDRIPSGGIVAFISNGAWIDSVAGEGFRRCLAEEFSSIYVLNLRGNANSSGEFRKREGGGIFAEGSKTPVAITFLVKNPKRQGIKADIHYYDIGDYLSREEKLNRLRNFRSIASEKIVWQTIEPNDKADWINQRDGLFDSLIPLGDKEKNAQTAFTIYSGGDITHRDAWCYDFSSATIADKMGRFISVYNKETEKCAHCKTEDEVSAVVNTDPAKIKWDKKLYAHALKGIKHSFNRNNIRQAYYRPFFKQWLYYDKDFNWSQYQLPKLFPTSESENLLICVSGVGSKNFSCLITDCIPDLQFMFNGQCFPLYWYEKKKQRQATLFDSAEEGDYVRHSGVSDWMLAQVRERFGSSRAIDREVIFYYVYGLLHGEDYRSRFADDLRKSLPRIPITPDVRDFFAFSKAGEELARLHLGYEKNINRPSNPAQGQTECLSLQSQRTNAACGVRIVGDRDIFFADYTAETYEYFAVTKMQFAKVRNSEGKLTADKSRILYNSNIMVENIPLSVYDYAVNGKPAVEWIMERCQVNTDKASQLKNDPNAWALEHSQPRYILDLLLSVIELSYHSRDIITSLPHIAFSEKAQED